MERKRTRLRVVSEEEEEEDDEEEWRVRRTSLREKKRIKYIEDDVEEEIEDEEEEKEDTEDKHNQMTPEHRFLPVTCGTKKGVLDVEKLDRGAACIICEGCWLTPNAFEDFGGRSSAKKWKTSIFSGNKSLQFWFEQGRLATKGYKKKGTTTTEEILPSNREPVKLFEVSEKQSVEETEEEGVKNEEWFQGCEDLALETEEERAGAENDVEVVESGDTKSKEEEEQMESVILESEELMILTHEKSRFQKKAKVTICRLPQAESHRLTNGTDHTKEDCWCKPFAQGACGEEEREPNGLVTGDLTNAAATNVDPPQISDLLITGVYGVKREDFAQSSERKDEQRENETETSHSASAFSSQGIIDQNKATGLISTADTAGLRTSPVLLYTVAEAGFPGNVTDGELEMLHYIKEENEWDKKEDLDMSRPEDSGQTGTTGNRDVTSSPAAQLTDRSSTPQVGYVHDNPGCTDVTPSGHKASQQQAMTPDTSIPKTTRGSTVAASSSSSNEDTMDLDQLKREKIKMQLKVLKLQEEYYSLKIKEFKK
ncbi:uncharacterized protein [Brachyistius frenatus]|uniref:uncharacterized protein n=1 Tax=Brachyistius frenatus TaxID=100188 RepID=UPI0037E8A1D0